MTISRHIPLAALVAVIAGSLAAVTATSAQSIAEPTVNPSGISVFGAGLVVADPDAARITLGVDITNQSLAAAQADAAQRMDAVVTRLRDSGIAPEDIKTVSYSINPQYDETGGVRGFQVQNLVSVRTTNISGLGGLLDAVVSSGATRIFGVRFEASDPDALKQQARDQAMQNARAKADQLARIAGVTVGRPIFIEDRDTGDVTPFEADQAPVAALAGRATAPSTPIQPGQLQVRSTVHVVWAIQGS